MTTKSVFAVSVLAVVLSAGQVFAESEGNGDPFPFRAAAQATGGSPFAGETWTEAHPQATGNTVQASSLAALEPATGSEAPVHTAQSLPKGFGRGTVAYVQAASLSCFLASYGGSGPVGRFLTAGTTRPGG